MSVHAPHYLLFSESSDTTEPGRWRFVLRSPDGSEKLMADDVEPDARGERLELLTVVRGLEALDQPSKVTLMTRSASIREGIRYGLSEWRANGWRWESFGQMIPVKNRDLWQRVDRALCFHQVECRSWRFDRAHGSKPTATPEPPGPLAERGINGEAPRPGVGPLTAELHGVGYRLGRVVAWVRQRVIDPLVSGDRTWRTRHEDWHPAFSLGKLIPLARSLGLDRMNAVTTHPSIED